MKIAAILPLLLAGCIGPPDHLMLTAGKGSGEFEATGGCTDYDSDTTYLEATLAFPITYQERHTPREPVRYYKYLPDPQEGLDFTVTGTRFEVTKVPVEPESPVEYPEVVCEAPASLWTAWHVLCAGIAVLAVGIVIGAWTWKSRK